MINRDFSNLNEYRADGRKATELRETKIDIGIDPNVDGSCIFRYTYVKIACEINWWVGSNHSGDCSII